MKRAKLASRQTETRRTGTASKWNAPNWHASNWRAPKWNAPNWNDTCGLCARIVWRFLCSPAMARDGKIIQRQHVCHYGDTICHPMSGYVTTKLHWTSTADATIMRYFQTELSSRFLPSPYPATLIWPRQSIGSSCLSSDNVELIIFRVQNFVSA